MRQDDNATPGRTGRDESEALRRERDEALAARQSALALLATVSHELRTPLTGILGMINLLLGTALDDEQHEYAVTARAAGDHLLRLVGDVIDLSRLEAGGIDLRPAPAVPGEIVRGVADIVAPQAAAKRLALSWSVEAGLEERFLFDGGRLRQVLLNLAANAVKYTDQGKVTIEAGIERDGAGRPVAAFHVCDSGIGMPDAVRAALFRRFTRAGPAARRGAGLGLAISGQIVALMGGTIAVDSTPGAGSVFRVVLPLPPRAADRPDQPGRDEPAPTGTDETALDLLLADDDALNRLFVSTLLRKGGHAVIAVADGAAAVDALRRRRFDAVLMDLRMPGMDGATAARAIRALPDDRATVPVIALTAETVADGGGGYEADGFAGAVEKPVRPAALARALGLATGRSVAVPDYAPARAGSAPAPTAAAERAIGDFLRRTGPDAGGVP